MYKPGIHVDGLVGRRLASSHANRIANTARTKKILDENPDLKRKWTALIPVGEMGRPEDLMGAVTYLASDASLYVTGADLRVDGGYTIT